MAMNKNWKQGAEDMGHIATKALNKQADGIEAVNNEFQKVQKMQYEINNAVFDMLDNDADRLDRLELNDKTFSLKQLYNYDDVTKTKIASYIMRVRCNGECNRYAAAVCGFMGITPTVIDGVIPKLDAKASETCAMILYRLRALSNDEVTEYDIDDLVKNLTISQIDLDSIHDRIYTIRDKFGNDYINYLLSELSGTHKYEHKPIDFIEKGSNIKAIVLGRTGAGKSELINSIFRAYNAEIGIGVPVTDQINKFSDRNSRIIMYDTPGITLDNYKNFTDNIIEQIKKENIDTAIYCVNSEDERFEKFEATLINSIRTSIDKINVYIAVTKCLDPAEAKQFIDYIGNMVNNITIFAVLAKDKNLNGAVTIEAYGIDELVRRISRNE